MLDRLPVEVAEIRVSVRKTASLLLELAADKESVEKLCGLEIYGVLSAQLSTDDFHTTVGIHEFVDDES